MRDLLYHIQGLAHEYGGKKVVDIQDLKIERGSILGVSGANGSGKSTLLKLLAFAMPPTRGKICFNGRPEAPMSPRIRSNVTLLTQTPYLLKRSVFQNVAYGLKIRKDRDRVEARVSQALETVGLPPAEFAKRMWHELSGGEAQRVATAARLILKPQALLLDEPVASVDLASAALIRRASLAAREEWGCTLVIVSHDLSWLHEVSDTRISMAAGKLFSTGEESVIPGPYETDPAGRLVKPLGNGDALILSDPPENDRTAVVRKEKIRLYSARNQSESDLNQVAARVDHMLLEKKTGDILTTLTLGSLTLTISVTQHQADRFRLRPGSQVIVAFSPRDISWR